MSLPFQPRFVYGLESFSFYHRHWVEFSLLDLCMGYFNQLVHSIRGRHVYCKNKTILQPVDELLYGLARIPLFAPPVVLLVDLLCGFLPLPPC